MQENSKESFQDFKIFSIEEKKVENNSDIVILTTKKLETSGETL